MAIDAQELIKKLSGRFDKESIASSLLIKNCNDSQFYVILTLLKGRNVSTKIEELRILESNLTDFPSYCELNDTQLTNLRVLDFSNMTSFGELPESIGTFTSIEELRLGNTSLKSLPTTIENLKNLKILDVHSTKISELPIDALRKLPELETLDISGCSVKPITIEELRMPLPEEQKVSLDSENTVKIRIFENQKTDEDETEKSDSEERKQETENKTQLEKSTLNAQSTLLLPDKPWLDIPAPNAYPNLTASTNENFHSIVYLLQEYHKLEKTSKDSLFKRVWYLNEIKQDISKILDETETSSISTLEREELLLLLKGTNGKYLYLNALAKKELDPNYITQYLFGGPTKLGHLRSGALHQERGTSGPPPGLGYDITAYDPCFRDRRKYPETRGGDTMVKLYKAWGIALDQCPKNEQNKFPSFFMWLEDKDNLTRDIPYEPEQMFNLLNLRRCNFKEGVVYFKGEQPKNGQKYIYSIDQKGDLYLSETDYSLSSAAQNHPDINSADLPVLCAGELTFLNGKIATINNRSGHFTPTPKQLERAVNLLKTKNLFSTDACFAKKTFLPDYLESDFPRKLESVDFSKIQNERIINKVRITDKEIAQEVRLTQGKNVTKKKTETKSNQELIFSQKIKKPLVSMALKAKKNIAKKNAKKNRDPSP